MQVPAFIKDLGERAGKSALQGFAVGAGLSAIGSATDVTFTGIPWLDALNLAGGMAVASVVTSLLSYKAGDTGTASFVKLDDAG